MIYNVVLVSGVQLSDSVIHTYIYIHSFSDSFIYLISFWLCWVFVAVRGLLIAVASLVAEHGL